MSESSLLERVEAATGADREIDALIAEELGDFAMVYRAFDGDGAMVDVTVEQTEDDFDDCPRYTASLDAALALTERVLPGWDICLSRIAEVDQSVAWLASLGPPLTLQSGPDKAGPTPALALLAALLTASNPKEKPMGSPQATASEDK